MNALIRKEVRSILPAWILAMVLATLPVWIVWPGPGFALFQNLGVMVFGPFALGVLLLSITPFGQELNWGTFSVLLSQPVSRNRLWKVKTIVLAVALGCAFIALCISNHIRVDSILGTMKNTVWRNAFSRPGQDNQYFLKMIADTRRDASLDTLMAGGLAVLAGFAGGLWTTLLFRQVTAAFWFTGLVPLGLSLLTGKVLGNLPDTFAQGGLLIVLMVYSAAGFIWAKRLFLRVQDTQWTGGVIALPQWGGLAAGQASRVPQRTRKPLRALLRKEFQAQHVNLLLAGGLLVVHLAVILLRKLSSEYLASHQFTAMTVEEFPRLWLAMPLLVGSVVVAEERKLGTLESVLCLPATRRIQFSVKLVIALLLGLVLGGVLPLVLEQLASFIGVRGNSPGSYFPPGLYFLGEIRSTMLLQLAGSVVLTGLALYGSSLTRNTLQAMGVGLVASLIACIVIFVAGQIGNLEVGDFEGNILWRGPLVGLIGWPVMLAAFVILAFRNFKRLQPDGRAWFRNCLTLLVSLAGVAVTTTVIYHRAWEAWLPEEPAHHGWMNLLYPATNVRGGAVGERPVSTPKLRSTAFRTAAVLPDGRLWVSQRQVRVRRTISVNRSSFNQGMIRWYATGPLHTGFVPGSNWKDVAVTDLGCFGIRTDGSLWDLSELHPGDTPKRAWLSHDWETIAAGEEHFCALKPDGTLWEWGERQDPSARTLSVQKVPIPVQVGNDTDWVDVCVSRGMSVAMKADGSIWRWAWASKAHALPERWLEGPCNRPVSLTLGSDAVAAVCEDGTLWIGGELTNSVYMQLIGAAKARLAQREMVRWGNDSDWKEIQFVGWGQVVGIKRDGSMWEWNFTMWYGAWARWVIPLNMPSQYMDWVTVCGKGNAFLALARDGTLSLWGDPEEGHYYDWNGPDSRRLMMPSRIKARRVADLSR